MSKSKFEGMTSAEIEDLIKQAKIAARERKKEERKQTITRLGTIILQNTDSIISCDNLDIDLRKKIAEIIGKEIPSPVVATTS